MLGNISLLHMRMMMVSLYKRATPMQMRMLRIVEGAVLNTVHAHPEPREDLARFARGVAKRAVGTLTAQLPEVLALDHTNVTD